MWDLVQVETEILARGPINKPITIIGICDYPNNTNTPGYRQHAYMQKRKIEMGSLNGKNYRLSIFI